MCIDVKFSSSLCSAVALLPVASSRLFGASDVFRTTASWLRRVAATRNVNDIFNISHPSDFTPVAALPRVLCDTPAKCEAGRMNGSRETGRQTDRDSQTC